MASAQTGPVPGQTSRPRVAAAAPRKITPKTIIGLAVLVVVIVAMALSTKFLTPTELAAIAPKQFDAAETAADLYDKAKTEIPAQASNLGQVVPAFQSDPKAAADTYKAVSPNEGAYVFKVKATGTVVEATDADLTLKVTGVPSETTILVPLTTAINGTVLRDAMGFKFADAPGQTDYQYVGDELKKLILADLGTEVPNPASLKGKTVEVVGVVSVIPSSGNGVPKAKPVNVQPLTVKAQ